MDYIGEVGLVHMLAVDETIRYLEKHGERTTYDGLVKHLSWYWANGKVHDQEPQGWVFDWIRFLTE